MSLLHTVAYWILIYNAAAQALSATGYIKIFPKMVCMNSSQCGIADNSKAGDLADIWNKPIK